MNRVAVTGKVSRVGRLKYTPSGQATLDFTVAVPQKALDKESMGHFEAMLFGPQAESAAQRLKVGLALSLKGRLWGRSYKNRQGTRISEIKIVVASLEPAPKNREGIHEGKREGN